MTRTILANAKLILPDDTTIGALVIEDGAIAEILPGTSVPPGALDMQGDHLAPGMVELHTDNLERHMRPRPGVDWPHASAILPMTRNWRAAASPRSLMRCAWARSPATGRIRITTNTPARWA